MVTASKRISSPAKGRDWRRLLATLRRLVRACLVRLDSVHASLAERELLRSQHFADTAHVNSELLVSSRRGCGIGLVGRTRNANGSQSKLDAGYAATDFAIDWERQQATYATGKTRIISSPAIDSLKSQVIDSARRTANRVPAVVCVRALPHCFAPFPGDLMGNTKRF